MLCVMWKCYIVSLVATVGLGVSDFGYRIFVSVVSVVSCMDCEHGFSVWIRCTNIAIAKRKRRRSVMRSIYILLLIL